MATTYEIPVTPGGGNQSFSIDLGGTSYQFALNWRAARDAGWVLDISDANGAPLVAGIPLVAGTDLLAPFRHLPITGSLFVTTDGDPDAPPTFANLGGLSHLYWVSPE